VTRGRRSAIVSSFTIIKGAMIEETYAVFAGWDSTQSKRKNLDRLRAENFIGATSATWLRDVAWAFNRRFDPNDRDRALVILAKHGVDLDTWKPLMLWHMTRDEFLVRDFLVNWLYPAYEAGTFRVHADDLLRFLDGMAARGAKTERAWSETTRRRVAAGLMKLAVDFGLLRGSAVKEFASYHLPEPSFLYLVHSMLEHDQAPGKLVGSPEWRMFLMAPADVERELLRLHQFRKLDYQVAGSIVQLSLPQATTREYVERMVA
jgi:hypothetical protein